MAEAGRLWTDGGNKTTGRALVDGYLAEELRRLRVRAGNPSLRELERLTERRDRRMSRASIQDKFSGNSTLKMVHLLALVRACADYALSIGAPLSPEDTDEKIWQERVAQTATHKGQEIVESPSRSVSTQSQHQQKANLRELEELIPPLIHAGMEDIASLAKQGATQPLEDWIPPVLVALSQAQMDYQGFLNLAADAPPGQAVQILRALTEAESEDVGNRYFQTCLLTRHPSGIPKLLVALRRCDDDFSFWYAQHFIDAILGIGDWRGVTRYDLADVLRALRTATLKDDADKLAEFIGVNVWPRVALATAGNFPNDFLGDRELILYAAASQGGPHRLLRLIDCLKREEIPGIKPDSTLDYILSSIPRENRAEYAGIFDDAGMKSEAHQLRELEVTAPF